MTTTDAAAREVLLWEVGEIQCVSTPDVHGLVMRAGRAIIIDERHPAVTDVVNRGIELERFVRALDAIERADLIRAARLRNVLRPPQWHPPPADAMADRRDV